MVILLLQYYHYVEPPEICVIKYAGMIGGPGGDVRILNAYKNAHKWHSANSERVIPKQYTHYYF